MHAATLDEGCRAFLCIARPGRQWRYVDESGGGWSQNWARGWIDTGAGQPLPEGHELAELRKETDQRVLANLLRMSLARAGR